EVDVAAEAPEDHREGGEPGGGLERADQRPGPAEEDGAEVQDGPADREGPGADPADGDDGEGAGQPGAGAGVEEGEELVAGHADAAGGGHLLVAGHHPQGPPDRARPEPGGEGDDGDADHADGNDQLPALGDVEAEQVPVVDRQPRRQRRQPGPEEQPAGGGEPEGQGDDGQGQPPDPKRRKADDEAGHHGAGHAEEDGRRQRDREVGVGPGRHHGPHAHERHLGQGDLARPVDEQVEPRDGDGGDHHLDEHGVGELGEGPGADEGGHEPDDQQRPHEGGVRQRWTAERRRPCDGDLGRTVRGDLAGKGDGVGGHAVARCVAWGRKRKATMRTTSTASGAPGWVVCRVSAASAIPSASPAASVPGRLVRPASREAAKPRMASSVMKKTSKPTSGATSTAARPARAPASVQVAKSRRATSTPISVAAYGSVALARNSSATLLTRKAMKNTSASTRAAMRTSRRGPMKRRPRIETCQPASGGGT